MEAEIYIRGEVKSIQDKPRRQQISSFNALTEDEMACLCQAIPTTCNHGSARPGQRFPCRVLG